MHGAPFGGGGACDRTGTEGEGALVICPAARGRRVWSGVPRIARGRGPRSRMPQPPATGCYRWTIIHTKAATLPVAGRDGRLWITGSDGAVYSTMPSEQGGAGASLEWTRIDPPANRVAGKVALD